MKRLRILQTACALASLLMLAACTPDEVTDDTRLPEGKYPFTLTAEMNGLAATTRATADGSWEGNEKVAVQETTGNGAVVKEYTVTQSTGALTSTNPFYWQKTTEEKQVSAWYVGTGEYKNTQPTAWSVKPDQSQTETGKSSSNYQCSDFLYAPQTGISYGSSEKKLTFYHQTAKVVINIRNAAPLTQTNQITSISINNVALNGNFSVSDGLKVEASASKTNITPKQATANTGVNFGSGSSEAALASYEALVIPQEVKAGDKFIGITLTDDITYYYKAVANYNKLEAGHVHTYNITVKGGELKATVSNNIGWGPTGGASGSVSVDFGYTISGDGTWTVYNKDGLLAWADHVRANTANLSTNCTLAENIDLGTPATGGSNWTAVGTNASEPYTGTFDGNGHAINNLTTHLGMFNYIKNATIKNLNLKGVSSSNGNGDINLSGVVKFANNSTIIACSVSGNVNNSDANGSGRTGGVIGYTMNSNVVACYSTCSVVTAGRYAGGVVGHAGTSYTTYITGCYSSGSVTSSYSQSPYAGGVVGYLSNSSSANFLSCYWSKKDNKPEKGIGDSNTSNEVKEVNGSSVTWSSAITAMNTAIKTWNNQQTDANKKCQYHYVPGSGTGTSPTLETGAPN